MNEMEVLRDFCAELAPPEPQRLAAIRAQVAAGFGAAPPARSRRRLSLRPLTGGVAPLAAAVATVAVVAGAQVLPSVLGGAGPASRAEQPGAAAVLNRAALAASRAPALGTGQFIYAQTTYRDLASGHGQDWVSVTGTRPSAETDSWCTTVSCRFSYRPGSYLYTYDGLTKLPTAPSALLHDLYRAESGFCQGSIADVEWSAFYAIVSDVPLLPPRFGAALFTAVAQIPGLRVIRNVTTVAGQKGIAVAHTVRTPADTYQVEVIFDRYSYRSIGTSIRWIATAFPHRGQVPVAGLPGIHPEPQLAWTGSRFVATTPATGGYVPPTPRSMQDCLTTIR